MELVIVETRRFRTWRVGYYGSESRGTCEVVPYWEEGVPVGRGKESVASFKRESG